MVSYVRIYQRFLGKVTFAGRLSIEERMKRNLAEANAVSSAWWQEFGDELEMLKDRYREVKEEGGRPAQSQDWTVTPHGERQSVPSSKTCP